MFPDSCPGTSKYLEVHYACVSARNPGSSSARKIPPWMRKQIKDKPKKKVKVAEKASGGVPSSTASSAPRKPILVTDKAAPTTTTSTAAPTTAKTTTQVVEVNSRRREKVAPRINDLSSHR